MKTHILTDIVSHLSAAGCGFVAGCIISAVLTADARNEVWQREAVTRGAAEYITDLQSGVPVWQWKELK